MGYIKAVAVILLMALAFVIGRYRARLADIEQGRDTLVVHDTIRYYQPIPKDSAVIRYVTIEVPRSKPHWEKDCTIVQPADTLPIPYQETKLDTAIGAREREEKEEEPPVTIHIPITQKHYSGKDYEAWVSGYRPSLDSISIQSSHTSIVHKQPSRRKRWGVGLQVGYGVTLSHRPELYPYIGVGVTYNIFNW